MKKHNKFIAGIMAVCLAFGVGVIPEGIAPVVSVTASAEVAYTKGKYENLTYKNYGDYIEISSLSAAAKDVVIPSEIDGVPVTRICDYLCYTAGLSYSLTSIEIPDSVTYIGTGAFYNCQKLTSIKIPDSVTYIGLNAFNWCESLTSIEIPDSVTYIGAGAFDNTPWIEKKLSENQFVIVNNILIGTEDCPDDVVIPDNVTGIACTFQSDLTSVKIPESVTYIDSKTFYDCKSLTSVVLPENLTEISEYTFTNCESLKSVNIPDSVTNIGKEAFSGCKNLTTINIPDGVTNIGDSAFSGCRNLTEINIPDNITIIRSHTFSSCTSLTTINIPDSITSIGSYAFDNCKSLTEINIPDSVTFINNSAFTDCTSLTTINIPDSVTNIIEGTFKNCDGLTTITIPDSVKSIGKGAFCYCNNLSSIIILNPDCEIFDCDWTISNKYDINSNRDTFDGTIYGYENSTAQAYAEKYGYKFESLGKAPEKITATGDLNGDNEFNISDVVTFQKYILGDSDMEISDWKQADFTGDGLLDVFDLVMMRKKLIEK